MDSNQHTELLLRAMGELETLRNSTRPLGYPHWASCEQAIVTLGGYAKRLEEELQRIADDPARALSLRERGIV